MSYANQSDSEEEETGDEVEPKFGQAAITFLIDCRRDMFTKDLGGSSDEDDENETHSGFVLGLKCCRATMLEQIQHQYKTMVSVMLFGVKNDVSVRKHCVELQPLSVSSAEKIKSVDRMAAQTQDWFEETYGHSDEAFLADVLSACVSSFNRCTKKLGSKRIVIFTKDDFPDSTSNGQHQIRKRVGDLYEAGIDLDLVPIGSSFDVQKFYQEVIKTVKRDDYTIMRPVNEDTQFSDVYESISKAAYKKNTIARLKFSVGKEVVIGVGFYRFTTKAQYIKAVNLFAETNEPVQTQTKYVKVECGSAVRPYELKKSATIGTKTIEFPNDTLLKIKKVFSPGMKLLGFKPRDSWKTEYHNSTFFLFPDESIVKGSSRFFKALLSRCKDRNMVAICVVTTRHGSRPRYVVLVPQEEVINEDTSVQSIPSGFLVHYLPFERMLPDLAIEPVEPKINENQMSLMTSVAKKMKLKRFVPDYFENPSLAKHWTYIEALALQQDHLRPFHDAAVESILRLKSRLADLSVKFNEVFPQSLQGSKRKITGESSGGAKKMKLVDAIDQLQVHTFTVSELKEILSEVPNVNMKGLKKADLVQLVYSNKDKLQKP